MQRPILGFSGNEKDWFRKEGWDGVRGMKGEGLDGWDAEERSCLRSA